ncbi:MAG: hypothetical protein JW809_11820 [Pirellulales bacterium]|nr:hypothetical protein [Pirellulales bacterium]
MRNNKTVVILSEAKDLATPSTWSKAVSLSEAKDLACLGANEILRFAQDDEFDGMTNSTG